MQLLEFVTFHSDRPAWRESVSHPNTNLAASQYARMIDLLFRSARLFCPGARFTLLTDAASNIQGVRDGYRRVNASVDHDELMLSRTRAQNDYVQANDFDRPILLIDSDILINGSVEEIFAQDFDVALTWRLSESMPINGGLLILNNRRPERAKKFMAEVLGIYEAKYSNSSSWFGDQLAIFDWVGIAKETLGTQTAWVKDGYRILLVPCDTYNFSPHNTWWQIRRCLAGRPVLHFKGERKRLMEPYWQAHLRYRERPGLAMRLKALGWQVWILVQAIAERTRGTWKTSV